MECSGSMKEPEYLAINPMGKVVAIRHDGQVVTEAAAICTCLAEAFPDAGLAPTSEEHAAYYRWLFFAAGPLEYATTTKALGQDSDDRFGTYDGYDRYCRRCAEPGRLCLRRSLYHGGRLFRQPYRMGPWFRQHSQTTVLRSLCRAHLRPRRPQARQEDRRGADCRTEGGSGILKRFGNEVSRRTGVGLRDRLGRRCSPEYKEQSVARLSE